MSTASELSNSVIWITGASSGIGEALAYAFSKRGARLILSARREDELDRVKASCHGNPDQIKILPLDLSQTESLQAKADAATKLFGHVDVLINNGGMSQRATAMEASLDVIRHIMEVNFFGTIALTKAILPHFTKRKSGYVVVISSVMGKFGTKFRSTYAASKHALQGWFDCLRQEMYDYNVDVTLVCPGYVKTPITVNALTADGKPFGKMGTGQQTAMTAEVFADKLLPKLEKRKSEIYIGGKEVYAVYLKRFIPGVLNRILRNMKVT